MKPSIINRLTQLWILYYFVLSDTAEALFPAVFSLASLNGTVGFRIDGEKADDQSGNSVSSVGDINGDGVSDLIIGAQVAGPNGQNAAGSSYVVYGSKSGIAHPLLLASLNGTVGFRIDGEKGLDFSGDSVSSVGDINGDGVSDLIIGAHGADPNGQNDAGSSYVVYGSKSGIAHPLLLSSLNGATGFRIDGEKVGDYSGSSVSSAGDINGDDVSDLIIGAQGAGPNGQNAAGSSYVVYGSKSGIAHPLLLSSLNGTTGFRIDGEKAEDESGYSVSSAGDVNDDGVGDLIIGAYFATPNGQNRAGSSYVVYGSKSGIAHPLLLSSLNGATGFRIDGEKEGDGSGSSVSSAGDINGDGVSDLLIGAPGSIFGVQGGPGSSYVVYGSKSSIVHPLLLSSLNGATGFRIDGEKAGDKSGYSVSSAGDINGDGMSDLLIGAPGSIFAVQGGPGSSYVVYGSKSGIVHPLLLSSLNGAMGFRIDGEKEGDFSGYSVSSAGDVNDDGVGDLIIGADRATPNGQNRAGSSYVIYGRKGKPAQSTSSQSILVTTHSSPSSGITEGATFSTLDPASSSPPSNFGFIAGTAAGGATLICSVAALGVFACRRRTQPSPGNKAEESTSLSPLPPSSSSSEKHIYGAIQVNHPEGHYSNPEVQPEGAHYLSNSEAAEVLREGAEYAEFASVQNEQLHARGYDDITVLAGPR